MKETFYFSHDYNPTSDPKIVCLLGNYGGLGYGIFWRIIEMLHQEETHKLPNKIYIYEAIAKQMLTDTKQIQTIVNDCIEKFELLSTDNKFFWSNRVNTNIEKRKEISEKRSNAGKAGAIAKQSLAKSSKGKEIKGNKRKENNIISSEQARISKLINPLIEKFKGVNPSYERLYANKTQRSALERMVKKFGENKIGSIIDQLKDYICQKFAPKITTPLQLEEKLGKLIAFMKSQEESKNKEQKNTFRGNPCYNAGTDKWPKWKVLENGEWKEISSGFEKEIIKI